MAPAPPPEYSPENVLKLATKAAFASAYAARGLHPEQVTRWCAELDDQTKVHEGTWAALLAGLDDEAVGS